MSVWWRRWTIGLNDILFMHWTRKWPSVKDWKWGNFVLRGGGGDGGVRGILWLGNPENWGSLGNSFRMPEWRPASQYFVDKIFQKSLQTTLANLISIKPGPNVLLFWTSWVSSLSNYILHLAILVSLDYQMCWWINQSIWQKATNPYNITNNHSWGNQFCLVGSFFVAGISYCWEDFHCVIHPPASCLESNLGRLLPQTGAGLSITWIWGPAFMTCTPTCRHVLAGNWGPAFMTYSYIDMYLLEVGIWASPCSLHNFQAMKH
jgi:hypothetical protein